VVGVAITLVLGVLSLLAQHRFYADAPLEARPSPGSLRRTLRGLPAALKRLLLAESVVRAGQGLAEVFVGLYVTNVLGLSAATFGTLVALRMATSILIYLLMARLADRARRRAGGAALLVAGNRHRHYLAQPESRGDRPPPPTRG
jgi:hypothetical protein